MGLDMWNGESEWKLTEYVCSLQECSSLLPQLTREGIIEEKHVYGFLLRVIHEVVSDCPLN